MELNNLNSIKLNYNDKFNNDLAYAFYSVKKNEDAAPAIVEYKMDSQEFALIVCADGLGGSGAEKVEIDLRKLNIYKDEILNTNNGHIILDKNKCFKTEFDNINSEEDYFNLLMKGIEPDNLYTNALLASRIVIFRYINYVINNNIDFNNEADLEKITKFIKSAMINIKEKFPIEKKNDKFSILPTTLVSIRYNKTKNLIDVIWVGDSRAYILTNNGLVQLSKDNEDESGLMTNIFAYDRLDIKIYHRSYDINKLAPNNKFVLITASDGFFDPFSDDYLMDESLLLSNIENFDSIKECYTTMKNILEKNYFSDDITVAFYPVGFNDYNDLKESFMSRYKFIYNLEKKYESYEKYLRYIKMDEKEALDYVSSRTKTIRKRIIAYILDNLKDFNDLFDIGKIIDGDKFIPYISIILNNDSISNINNITKYIDPKYLIYRRHSFIDTNSRLLEEKRRLIGDESNVGYIKDLELKLDKFKLAISDFASFFNDNQLGTNLSLIMEPDKTDKVDLLINNLVNAQKDFVKALPKRFTNSNVILLKSRITELITLHNIIENKNINNNEVSVIYDTYLAMKNIVESIFNIYVALKKVTLDQFRSELSKVEQDIKDNEDSYKAFLIVLLDKYKYNLDEIVDLSSFHKLPDPKLQIEEKLNGLDEDTFVKEIIKFLGNNDSLNHLYNASALEEFHLYYDYLNEDIKNNTNELKKELNILKDNYSKYINEM